MIFKNIRESDKIKNKEVEELNKLFNDNAVLKKGIDDNWEEEQSTQFIDEPSISSNIYFVDNDFYVTYGAENENDYSQLMSWNAVMSSIQAPWDEENNQYNFYLQGQRITEFVAFSVNPDEYNDKLDYDNFAIIMKDGGDDTFVDLDSGGNLDSTHVAMCPYFVKRSVRDSQSVDSEVSHSNRITPSYEIRTSSDNSFFNYSSELDAIDIDWDVGIISEPLGVFYPTLGLVLIFPELLGDYVDLKGAIDGASDKSLTSLNYTMMLMGYGVTKKTKTVIFSRLFNNEFNITTNPTQFKLIGGELFQDEYIEEELVTFPTKIGYYNDMNELLAVAHFSQPFKKNPEEEFIIISNIEE